MMFLINPFSKMSLEALYYFNYMKNNMISLDLQFLAEEVEEDLESMQETAKRIFSVHSALLGRGFALASPPTVSQALDGVLPYR